MEAFGLDVSDSEAIDVDSSSAEEGRHISPSHKEVKRRLSGSASGSSHGVRGPTALSKEWVRHSDGRRQRINAKGHIESFDGVRSLWPSDGAMSDEGDSPSLEQADEKEEAEEEAKVNAEEEAKDKAEEEPKVKAAEEAQDKAEDKVEDKAEEEAKLEAGWAAAKAKAMSRILQKKTHSAEKARHGHGQGGFSYQREFSYQGGSIPLPRGILLRSCPGRSPTSCPRSSSS